jgi:hypothetical protein
MALPTTLKIYLNQQRWYFFERGMQRVWNDLVKLANVNGTATAIGAGARVSSMTFGTHTAAFTPSLPDNSEGRAGVGGVYAGKEYPRAGFSDLL